MYFLNAEILEEQNWRCGESLLTKETIMAWANGAWSSPLCPQIPKFRMLQIQKRQEGGHIRVRFSGTSACHKLNCFFSLLNTVVSYGNNKHAARD